MENQSLQQIIDELPQKFINEVMTETDTAILTKKLRHAKNRKNRVVIAARIQNLNHLVI